LQVRRKARNITMKEMQKKEVFPESTENIFFEEMGMDPYSTCMQETEFLLDKSFSSEIPFFGKDLFAGSIYMFYDKEPFVRQKSRRMPLFSNRMLSKKIPRMITKMKKRTGIPSYSKSHIAELLEEPFLYPLLINSLPYYYECASRKKADSLIDLFPTIASCESKLETSFVYSKQAIKTFFKKNKEKEEYFDTFLDPDGFFDREKLLLMTDELESLDLTDLPHDFPDEKMDELNKLLSNRSYKTNVKEIMTLIKSLFPNGANIKWIDYSCNNFSTDNVGCDVENEMLRALLRRKDDKFYFGGKV